MATNLTPRRPAVTARFDPGVVDLLDAVVAQSPIHPDRSSLITSLVGAGLLPLAAELAPRQAKAMGVPTPTPPERRDRHAAGLDALVDALTGYISRVEKTDPLGAALLARDASNALLATADRLARKHGPGAKANA